jgi:large subunit ribosomal protein L31|tara:strand:+ start:76 stop:480 length:405 start_codon:yes stop_codon:yes gene_type:complete
MKKETHPEYREVLFHDTSVDKYFLIPSTLNTDQTKEWEDGKTYPYYPLDISSASHPFYTGKHKIVDTGGRVDRFKKRFAKTASAEQKLAEASTEEVVEVAQEEVSEAPVEEVQEDVTEAPTEEVVEEETPKEKE